MDGTAPAVVSTQLTVLGVLSLAHHRSAARFSPSSFGMARSSCCTTVIGDRCSVSLDYATEGGRLRQWRPAPGPPSDAVGRDRASGAWGAAAAPGRPALFYLFVAIRHRLFPPPHLDLFPPPPPPPPSTSLSPTVRNEASWRRGQSRRHAAPTRSERCPFFPTHHHARPRLEETC